MICLFEDRLVEDLYPLTETRFAADLLIGGMTMRERVTAMVASEPVLLHGRGYLWSVYPDQFLPAQPTEPVLFLNARGRFQPSFFQSLSKETGWILRDGQNVVAARLAPEEVASLDLTQDYISFGNNLKAFNLKTTTWKFYRYLWEMIVDNGDAIYDDSKLIGEGTKRLLPDGVYRCGDHDLIADDNVTLQPGVVLDCTDGPVILGANITVMANSVIQGPCMVGANSTVKIGAKIYHGTTIGPWCKVGGEVENSIIIGCSNKQHDGFLGHSYLGAWVNLGADTNTSDLKNTYGQIRVNLSGREVDTDQMFIGSLIGDHSKTGINTMLNTGSVIGVFANIFGSGFSPKNIPSFSWCDGSTITPYRLDKALELAKRVMVRRKIVFSEADQGVLKYLYRCVHPESNV
ncbi:MAG: hypothetical protein J4G05_01190 [Chlorobi bacterium]|nr:hypothetical protein [Chlorobiota bacterium]